MEWIIVVVYIFFGLMLLSLFLYVTFHTPKPTSGTMTPKVPWETVRERVNGQIAGQKETLLTSS